MLVFVPGALFSWFTEPPEAFWGGGKGQHPALQMVAGKGCSPVGQVGPVTIIQHHG